MSKVKIEKLSQQEIYSRGIKNWGIWEKEVSQFEWHYDDTEECLLLEGEVYITTNDGVYHINAGDFVTFQKGLACSWDIRKKVRKHYNFI